MRGGVARLLCAGLRWICRPAMLLHLAGLLGAGLMCSGVQGRYSAVKEWNAPGRLQLQMPPLHTSCVQHLPASSAWLLPSGAQGLWLCARPTPV